MTVNGSMQATLPKASSLKPQALNPHQNPKSLNLKWPCPGHYEVYTPENRKGKRAPWHSSRRRSPADPAWRELYS